MTAANGSYARRRWSVTDVPRVPEDCEVWPRSVLTTWTRLGAKWQVRRLIRRHRKAGCWPDCSTLWFYDVRRSTGVRIDARPVDRDRSEVPGGER